MKHFRMIAMLSDAQISVAVDDGEFLVLSKQGHNH